MQINYLEIHKFRNLSSLHFEPSTKINIFYGLNGSGKTSILESIHYLGLGRSFRTRNVNRLIQYNADCFSLFSHLTQENFGIIPVGIERKRDSFTIKIAGRVVNSLIEVLQLFPLQLINADSHLLLTSGPVARRQFLDWGVFHVEPQFYNFWCRANRILKQRNSHLKSACKYNEMAFWDIELETLSLRLHEQRLSYFELLEPYFGELISLLLPSSKCTLHYKPGWNPERSLVEQLKASFDRDKSLGYTQLGPHRSDLLLKANQFPATDFMSQGQQKLAAYSLRIAQGKLLQQQTGRNCAFLIDDLPSELDREKRALICTILINMDTQMFVTTIDPREVEDLQQANDIRMFHVEHGNVD